MLGKLKSAAENRKSFTALQNNLSEAFHCLAHDAYDFKMTWLRLMQKYLANKLTD